MGGSSACLLLPGFCLMRFHVAQVGPLKGCYYRHLPGCFFSILWVASSLSPRTYLSQDPERVGFTYHSWGECGLFLWKRVCYKYLLKHKHLYSLFTYFWDSLSTECHSWPWTHNPPIPYMSRWECFQTTLVVCRFCYWFLRQNLTIKLWPSWNDVDLQRSFCLCLLNA